MVFEFEGTEISSFVDDLGRDWFKGTEICKALSISNSSVTINRVASEYSEEFQVGIGRPALYVSEPGLYALIFASRSKSAKKFQRWVFEEVLPSIRKTGTYKSPDMSFGQRLKSVADDIGAIAQSPEIQEAVTRGEQAEKRAIEDGQPISLEERGKIIAESLSCEQRAGLLMAKALPVIQQAIAHLEAC